MTACGELGYDVGSIAYATTSVSAGARGPNVLVSPRPDGADANGFDEPSLVFPGLLFPVTPRHVARSRGLLNDEEWRDLQSTVPMGLGCGRGTSRDGTETGIRGRIVQFGPLITARAGYLRYALILTPTPYSVHTDAFFGVVPLYPDVKRCPMGNLLVEEEAWRQALGVGVENVMIGIKDVLMVRRVNLVAGPPNTGCNDEQMRVVDDALLQWLGCAPAGASGGGAVQDGAQGAGAG